MMSGSKMSLEEVLKEIEILKPQNKKMGETLDSLNKKYDLLKLELELSQACHNEKCAKFNKLCFDYAKLQVKNEKFEQNIKNTLEIEKKNAVKEFAEKLKRVFHDDYVTPSGYADERLVFECVDDLLKEVFGNDEE